MPHHLQGAATSGPVLAARAQGVLTVTLTATLVDTRTHATQSGAVVCHAFVLNKNAVVPNPSVYLRCLHGQPQTHYLNQCKAMQALCRYASYP